MTFLIDDKLLEKYDKIRDKVSNSIKKEFDNEPAETEKYLRTKIKSYKGKIKTFFDNGKIPKEHSDCISLLL